ncbi:hypothetical protein [Gloeocapsopsis dulcis]|uniref:Hemerythrin-like domain-containing protein n=1 Tax=Gloeocapsopsis dulcis AAB1 = 1H9 TaxID=1433147 RepID=A0A6N8FR10_9CHRO|nr:hypothetical protein [Gloeocapsopsis dulcis]MUL34805.1 hypothetical protein [Gloeocapsopsis dulcis AAB1 = 1H9]WNN90127.1 hypothetical protein P0S91_03230 [Gloeocapsopsis dulcis]
MDVLDLIKQKYQKIVDLLSELCSPGIQKRYTIFNQLSQEINLLAELEQQTFYPFLRQRYPNHDEQIMINEGEYSRIQQLLEELESFSPASKEFEQKSSDMHNIVKYYIQEKVDKVLLEASKCLTNTERQQLSHEFIERQDFLNNY